LRILLLRRYRVAKFGIVRVESFDMSFNTGVWDIEHLENFGLVKLDIVGWLIEDREDCVIIAKELQPDENQIRHITAIPKVNIVKVTKLRSK